MHLSDLKEHPVIKFFVRAAFFLLIISFISFYGWSAASRQRSGREADYARYRSEDALSFLPWRKWDYIPIGDVSRAKDVVINLKLQLLDPNIQQFIRQQPNMNFGFLSSSEEQAQNVFDNILMKREADRLGLVIPRDVVVKAIKDAYGSNVDRYRAMLDRLGISEEQFIDDSLRDQAGLLARTIVASEAQVSLYDLWEEYRLGHEKLKLQMAAFPAKKYGDALKVADADLEAYLKERREEYRVPDQRRYEYVRKTLAQVREKLEPAPEQLMAFYQQNQATFNRQAGVKIEDLYAPVAADQTTTAALKLVASFKDELTTTGWRALAPRLEAKNPGSVLYYRDLGWIENDETARKIYGPAYVERAFALADDRISTPVQGLQGIHVIRALGRRPAGAPPLEEIKSQVLTKYKEQESKRLFKEETKKMDEEIKNHKTMREFAQAVGLDDALTTEVAATSALIPLAGSPSESMSLQESASYVRGLRLNELSQIISSPSRDPMFYCALEVVEEKPSHLPELKEVRAKVEADYRKSKGQELAKAEAEKAYGSLKGGADFVAAAAAAPEKPVETEPFLRKETVKSLKFPLIDFANQTARIGAQSTGYSAYGPGDKDIEGYALWKVVSLEPPTKEQFRKDRRAFERETRALLEMTVGAEWLADQRRHSGYEILSKADAR